jgi:hypothetical protein
VSSSASRAKHQPGGVRSAQTLGGAGRPKPAAETAGSKQPQRGRAAPYLARSRPRTQELPKAPAKRQRFTKSARKLLPHALGPRGFPSFTRVTGPLTLCFVHRRRRPPVRWRAAHQRCQLGGFVSSRFHWHLHLHQRRHSRLLAEPLDVEPPLQELALVSVSCQHERRSHLRCLPVTRSSCPQQRRLTLRSSGPPPAWHLAREPMQSIVPSRGPSTMPVVSAQLKR